jgi:hypothetical protein
MVTWEALALVPRMRGRLWFEVGFDTCSCLEIDNHPAHTDDHDHFWFLITPFIVTNRTDVSRSTTRVIRVFTVSTARPYSTRGCIFGMYRIFGFRFTRFLFGFLILAFWDFG